MFTFKTLIAPALGVATLMAGLNVQSAQAYQYQRNWNPYHNTSKQACMHSTKISTWQIGRKWIRGKCYAVIASSRSEYARYTSPHMRHRQQVARNRQCKLRYGAGSYYSTARKQCVRALNEVQRRILHNRNAKIARSRCGNNFIASATGWRCIGSPHIGGRVRNPHTAVGSLWRPATRGHSKRKTGKRGRVHIKLRPVGGSKSGRSTHSRTRIFGIP